MQELADHPDIQAIERTGYIRQPVVIARCSECGGEIYGEWCATAQSELSITTICPECVEEAVKTEMTSTSILGYPSVGYTAIIEALGWAVKRG